MIYTYRITKCQVAPGIYLYTRPLKGQRCEIVKVGRRRQVLVRFIETGELVITQLTAIRRVRE